MLRNSQILATVGNRKRAAFLSRAGCLTSPSVIESLQKLVPFLQQYPFWVRATVCAWVFFTAAVVVLLMFFHSPKADNEQKSQVVPNAPNIHQVERKNPSPQVEDKVAKVVDLQKLQNSAELALSFKEYLELLDGLDDPMLEENDFVKAVIGKVVKWDGHVHSVSKSEDGFNVHVSIRGGGSFFAKCSSDYTRKVYGLRKNDHVAVVGTLIHSHMHPRAPTGSRNLFYLLRSNSDGKTASRGWFHFI